MVKVEQEVKRRSKPTTKILKIVMIAFAVLFLLMAIAFSTGYMLFCFIFAGMYFLFEANADLEFEYVYTDNKFTVSVIKARRKRYVAHELDLATLEVVAPHEHEAVRMYKKGNGNDLKKYDYTSYEDGVEYYTMIIYEDNEKIKLLLDLNEEMLTELKKRYPTKIFI